MKVALTPIKAEDMRLYVLSAFSDDLDLLTQYHISPGSLDHCVDHTMEFIDENAKYYKDDIKFYAVKYGEVVIGYTIVILNEKTPNELYSFAINVNYRKKDILQEWLQEVKKELGEYYIVLWSKNTRAINFFEKNGFKVKRESKMLNDSTKTLILCPQAVLA